MRSNKTTLSPQAAKIAEFQEFLLTCFQMSGLSTDSSGNRWMDFSHRVHSSIRLLYCAKTGAVRLFAGPRTLYTGEHLTLDIALLEALPQQLATYGFTSLEVTVVSVAHPGCVGETVIRDYRSFDDQISEED